MIRVLYVLPEQLDQEWVQAGPMLELAQRRLADKMDLQDLYEDFRKGYQQLWAVKDSDTTLAAIATMLDAHPKSSIFRIMMVGGRNMQEWLNPALCVMKDAAKRLGCDTIEANCRIGWGKYAQRYGFKEAARVYELEI